MSVNENYAGELKVVVLSDEEGFFAQGLEIDHDAQGTTLEAVRANFEAGLAGLVRQRLSAHGKLDGLLKPTPADTWANLWDAGKVYTVSSVSLQSRQGLSRLPYAGISYFEQVPWSATVPAIRDPEEATIKNGQASWQAG